MSQTVTCTGAAFKGLTNPYTGEPLVVKMITTKSGTPKFFAPKTYSTYTRFGSKKLAYDNWAKSEGIEGVRKGQPIVCAYTGEQLVPKNDETGCYFDGGFDPRRFYTREEFLYYATMRNGVSKYAKPGEPKKVMIVREKPDRQILSHEPPMLEGSLEIAEDAMKKSGFAPQKKTKVSMSVSEKKAARK